LTSFERMLRSSWQEDTAVISKTSQAKLDAPTCETQKLCRDGKRVEEDGLWDVKIVSH